MPNPGKNAAMMAPITAMTIPFRSIKIPAINDRANAAVGFSAI
jgi:hypothetical protein